MNDIKGKDEVYAMGDRKAYDGDRHGTG